MGILEKMYDFIPDRLYLSLRFRRKMKRGINWGQPKTFSEKLQWLKLYDRRPEYTTMVDKYAVKKYVAEKIGEEYIIPTLGIWEKFDDIDFDLLPSQFVLKCTHDSGGLVICRDKSNFDMVKAKEKIERSLKRDYFLEGREWPYKNVPRRIIAEKYMEDEETKELRDYKFFCFNGKVKMLFIATERQNSKTETKFDFFDENFKHLPLKNGHSNASVVPMKPVNFYAMKELAQKLSIDIPHVRIDFYEVNGDIFFGEMTFFHHSGMVPFDPPEWDLKLGDMINLPKK